MSGSLLPRSALRGDHPGAYNVRRFDANTVVADYLEPAVIGADGYGAQYAIRQLAGQDVAIVDAADPIPASLSFGQSNSLNGGSRDRPTSQLTDALHPRTLLAFNVGNFAEGSRHCFFAGAPRGVARTGTISAFAPYADTPGSYLQAHTPVGIAVEDWRRRRGLAAMSTLTFNVGEGSEPLASFMPADFAWAIGKTQLNGPDPLFGGAPFNYLNLMAAVDGLVAAAAAHGRTAEVRTIKFCQGEGGLYSVGGGAGYVWLAGAAPTPLTETAYGAELERLLDRVVTDVMAKTGQTIRPLVLIMQTATSREQTAVDFIPPLAHLELCRRRPRDYWLVGTMRGIPLRTDSDVHPDDEGRFQAAGVWARAVMEADAWWDAQKRGATVPAWQAPMLDVGGAYRVAETVIRIPVQRPGRLARQPVVIDTDRLGAPRERGGAPPSFLGFVLRGTTASQVGVAGARLLDSGDVEVTLSAPPTGADATLDYAIQCERRLAGIVEARRVNNVVTVTTTTPHGVTVGEAVRLDGTTDPALHVAWRVLDTPNATSFTFANIRPNGVATGGVVFRPELSGWGGSYGDLSWPSGRGQIYVPDPEPDPLAARFPPVVRPAVIRHYLPAARLPIPPRLDAQWAELAARPSVRWFVRSEGAALVTTVGPPTQASQFLDLRSAAAAATVVLEQPTAIRRGEVVDGVWPGSWAGGGDQRVVRTVNDIGGYYQHPAGFAQYDFAGDWQLATEVVFGATVTDGAASDPRQKEAYLWGYYDNDIDGAGPDTIFGTGLRLRALGGTDTLTLNHGDALLDWGRANTVRGRRLLVVARRLGGVLTLRINGLDRGSVAAPGPGANPAQTPAFALGTRRPVDRGLAANADWRMAVLSVGNAAALDADLRLLERAAREQGIF